MMPEPTWYGIRFEDNKKNGGAEPPKPTRVFTGPKVGKALSLKERKKQLAKVLRKKGKK